MVQAGTSSSAILERLNAIAPLFPDVYRALSITRVDPATGCWVWSGAMQRPHHGGRCLPVMRQAARGRVVYQMFREALGEPRIAYMRTNLCSNERCVNPEHYTGGGGDISHAARQLWALIMQVCGARFPMPKRASPREQIAVFIACKLLRPGLSYPQIAALFGRHHATIIYDERRIGLRGPGLYGRYLRDVQGQLLGANGVGREAA